MNTIKDKLYFSFDGKNSKDFRLMSVNTQGGLFEEQFAPSRELNETRPEKSDTTMLHGIKEGERTFELMLAFENGFEDNMISDVIDWLFKDYYRPLYFQGQEDRIMFSMITGDSSLVHNGFKEGYVTLTVKTNSPYKYSRHKDSRITNNAIKGKASLELKNDGHKKIYPEYSIRKIGDGDLILSTGNKNVQIVNLVNGEDIYINSERGIIETGLVGAYRYDNIRAGELEDLYMDTGRTKLEVTGGAEIVVRYREVYRF